MLGRRWWILVDKGLHRGLVIGCYSTWNGCFRVISEWTLINWKDFPTDLSSTEELTEGGDHGWELKTVGTVCPVAASFLR